ncbi:helix-turn-helix transcriptional regulator [Amycolatopsis nigrescens]|uniref:helix-turn-helix transcriptional regulator n=1 Tax=Amycolatopsis nigrescens TaxID=381445 RepID=UPI00036CE503|nr:LuxR C-terminal-related transcriptional regulator [Amycolatopsis nigrescens]
MSQRVAAPPELILDEPTRQLCDAIARGGLASVRLAVVAPGEYGKTALLDHLAAAHAGEGPPVLRFGQPGSERIDEPAVVLVDDAHALGDAALGELIRLAGDDRFGLVVTARPRPRPALLGELLGRLRGQIVLRRFDQAQIEEYLAAAGRLPVGTAEFVRAQTGGVPGLVHRVVSALGDRLEPPAAALAGLGQELDRVEPDTLRFLLAAEAGAAMDVELVGALLERRPDDLGEVIDAARATGLFGPDGTLLPLGGAALRSLVPAERRAALRGRLAELRLAGGGPVLDLVRPWLDLGLGGASAGRAFEAAAKEALPTDPALAARLFDAAVSAGIPVTALGARWAEAAALSGDLDTALRVADQVIATAEAPDRAGAARVAATALAHRGQLARSAELHQWSGGARSRAFAAIGLVGTGRLDEAALVLDKSTVDTEREPPTLLSGALSAAARGVLESVTGEPTSALSTLVSSAEMLEPVGRCTLLPDSPAALAALVALHGGELAVAEPLLERAVQSRTGTGSLVARHRLLLAWIAMVRGETALAGARLAAAGPELEPREWLFSVALEVGLARRTSDLPALRRIWGQACEAVIRHRVDLFSILAFGEFAVAAARLGDRDRLAPHLAQAGELLHALGDPPLWATPLHWSGLHAAIIAEQTAEAGRHAATLAANAAAGGYYAVMSAAAGCWLKVLAGEVDPGEVESAARGLHGAGLCWDGARLAGQAAIRTSDRKAMMALLDCARLLQGSPAPERAKVDDAPGAVPLSERERQVARLVLDGLTYKQVGARLFISAKTVEHHMARMRQRLGATGRSELLSRLRALLGA